METYKGQINEFIDWVTGINSRTGENETTNLQVSGQSIRQLLQERLKQPFIYYEDKDAGLYRLFSSEASKNLWLQLNDPTNPNYDPDSSGGLELFSFVRPGDVALIIQGLDDAPRYIITEEGIESSEQAEIKFWVDMTKQTAGVATPTNDYSFVVTYTITDNNGKQTIFTQDKGREFVNKWTSGGTLNPEIQQYAVTANVFQYLTEGRNEINISVKANGVSASNSATIIISLVKFKLESTFDYNRAHTIGDTLIVPFFINRSIKDKDKFVTIKATIDNNISTTYSKQINKEEFVITDSIIISTIDGNGSPIFAANSQGTHIKHTLKLEAEMPGNLHSNVFEMQSSESGISNKFINIAYDTPFNKWKTNSILTGGEELCLKATQYSPFILNWAYYTDQTNLNSLGIQWALKITVNNETSYTNIANLTGINQTVFQPLNFIPSETFTENDSIRLVAGFRNNNEFVEIDSWPFEVDASQFSIVETSGMDFKINAYGKTNNATDKGDWKDSVKNVQASFSNNFPFDNTNGWNENSLVTNGVTNYIEIPYNPFSTAESITNGKTIEFEFKTERVINSNDVLIRFGNVNNGHIDVTPTTAGFYIGSNLIKKTDFKANEKIKLAFVFNRTNGTSISNNLLYIINNGILERAIKYGSSDAIANSQGNIKIGGSASGIRFYNARIYNTALTFEGELNNVIFDSTNKASIISRNSITDSSGKISYDETSGKIDTILIEGNLNSILNRSNTKTECIATLTRRCPTDNTKNFIVENARVRKHGQSTLNYPITALKIWLNKSGSQSVNTILTLSPQQQALGFNKNRYLMKNGAIPANKFVLQANYADSSGVHNGGLLRLINDTWYNAEINGEYKLRTAPQLFASGQTVNHNNDSLHENGWVEGYGIGSAINKTWKDISFDGKDFPYKIRVAPDSFPCAIFYEQNPSIKFLGQYVFMDDKKSDYCYGERSIYHYGNDSDPFVLTKTNNDAKQDNKNNRVWDNKDVLQVEVVLPNYKLTSYMSYNVDASYSIDENGNVDTSSSGASVPCDTIHKDKDNKNLGYYWEDFFDLIYPDPDDIEEDDAKDGLTKYDSNSKFVTTVQPFLTWLRWISIGELRSTNPTQAQTKFESEAAQHLDLYKLAAYYIFFLRFGLVDSVERNAQLKTYDGVHWHYEPWDMDIALGNNNQGVLAYNPPMTRDTRVGESYAYSGRSNQTSNVLWDSLENWEYWSTIIVPTVARALYKAGLTYENICKVFDEEYVDKWAETIYNEAGYFKYVQNGGDDWLLWLQGARTSHRHWWLSTSMNYYDAKWSCGVFEEKRTVIFANKQANSSNTDIVRIRPTANTFFKFTQNDGTSEIANVEAQAGQYINIDISNKVFSSKDPAHIYGSMYIEEIDVSCFGAGLFTLDLSNAYDSVLGAPVKKVYAGISYTTNNPTQRTGNISTNPFRLTGVNNVSGEDALENVELIDVTGQSELSGGISGLLENRSNITHFYATGVNSASFVNSIKGNTFEEIELPSELQTITLYDCSWNNMSFWKTTAQEASAIIDPETGQQATDSEGNKLWSPASAIFDKVSVPASITTIRFNGSTASNNCAGQLLLEWISSIETAGGNLNDKTFIAENINWGEELNITYNTLEKIAQLNNGNNSSGTLKGYIVLNESTKLSAQKLSNITKWFGNNAFNIGSRNSNLVIDQKLDYVQVSVSGEDIIIDENDNIYLEEPKSAILTANRFSLGSDDTTYNWQVTTNIDNWSSIPAGINIETGSDGQTYLRTSQTAGGRNRTIYIRAEYVENSTAKYSEIVEITIIGVTYPNSINWNITGNPRKFLFTNNIGSKVFGNANNYIDNGVLRETYVLPSSGIEVIFELQPVGSYTATLTSIDYQIISQGQTPYDEYMQMDIINNSAKITVNNIPNSGKEIFTLIGSAKIGAQTFYKRVNLILMDDNVVLLQASGLSLFQTISAAYASKYISQDSSIGMAYFNFYKSHLLSLDGILTFGNEISDFSLDNSMGKLFDYIPYVSGITLDAQNFNLSNQLDFSNMPNITSITINNNSNLTESINIPNTVTSVNFEGTSLGVNIKNGSYISNLSLGSPYRISIVRPRILTQLSAQNSNNLENINIEGVNIGDTDNPPTLAGFNIFKDLMRL